VSLRSPEVVWQPELPQERRAAALGQRGATVWFTGLPSSGKSTIAAAVQDELLAEGRFAYVLDGDNLRHGLCGDLGFSLDDRAENVRRAAHAARLLADAGAVTLVSLVSPYAADRELARELHEADDIPFLEVYVATPLDVCESRDPKGLYARARAGELSGFTGVDDPYEAPEAPDLVLCPDQGVAAGAAQVVAAVPPVL
jgi:adenylyl-sulfate kinase